MAAVIRRPAALALPPAQPPLHTSPCAPGAEHACGRCGRGVGKGGGGLCSRPCRAPMSRRHPLLQGT
eukprot:190998-Pelagomonas_calceolata.AAC.1